MYLKNCTQEHRDKMRSYKGTKTSRELLDMFDIKNKDIIHANKYFRKHGILYKGQHLNRGKDKAKKVDSYRAYQDPIKPKPLELIKGMMYKITNKADGRKETASTRAVVVEEYNRFYLVENEEGFCECISKWGEDLEVVEI